MQGEELHLKGEEKEEEYLLPYTALSQRCIVYWKLGQNGSIFILVSLNLNTYLHRRACIRLNWQAFNLVINIKFIQ
jgi:hypothetical protein